jgi:hypothetical protein
MLGVGVGVVLKFSSGSKAAKRGGLSSNFPDFTIRFILTSFYIDDLLALCMLASCYRHSYPLNGLN